MRILGGLGKLPGKEVKEMPVIKHVHTYVQYKKRPGYFRCAAPDCTHFLDKESVVGKHSLCNECGAIFTLTPADLQRVRPKCINCSNTKKAKRHRKAQELTRYLGTDAFGSPGHISGITNEELDFYDKPIVFSHGESEKEDEEPE